MNICEDRHEQKYQITYKSAKGSKYAPVWLVCEACMENQDCFGSKEQVESVSVLA